MPPVPGPDRCVMLIAPRLDSRYID